MRAMDPGNTSEQHSIRQNLASLRKQIDQVARQAGRNPDEIKLIAVSKTRPISAIQAARDDGQVDFGENTIQDAFSKIPAFIDADIRWHFIGHVQSRKAKDIPGNFQWLHSLDSISLAEKLQRAAESKAVTLNVLLQINVGNDPKKHGLSIDGVPAVISRLLGPGFANLRLRGLMTIGPNTTDRTEQQQCFSTLRQLRDSTRQQFSLDGFSELSMGMSNDYAAAITEGATLLRIGSKIFGKRQ